MAGIGQRRTRPRVAGSCRRNTRAAARSSTCAPTPRASQNTPHPACALRGNQDFTNPPQPLLRKKSQGQCLAGNFFKIPKLAPEVGLEPTTRRLTVARSTTELLRNASTIILARPTLACATRISVRILWRIGVSMNAVGFSFLCRQTTLNVNFAGHGL